MSLLLPFRRPLLGSPLWTPARISTALWLDAADASTITLNGSTVSQWSDKSGNGRHVSQSTAAGQPAYIANALSNKAAIRTDGFNRLEANNTSLFRNVNNAIWAVVAKHPPTLGVVNAMHVFCSTSVPQATRFGLTANPSGNAFMGLAGRRLDADPFTTIASSASRIVNSYFIEVGNANYESAQANHWTNGTQDITAASFLTAGNTSDIDASAAVIFGPVGIPSPAGTEIAEAIAIHGSLSTSNRQKLEGYLAHKWLLTANLPNGHPFRNRPPRV